MLAVDLSTKIGVEEPSHPTSAMLRSFRSIINERGCLLRCNMGAWQAFFGTMLPKESGRNGSVV
jgi:hypothetical protein